MATIGFPCISFGSHGAEGAGRIIKTRVSPNGAFSETIRLNRSHHQNGHVVVLQCAGLMLGCRPDQLIPDRVSR